ncbi:SDR family NAD(P)-dependent oxidoreductase [Brevibacillus sp. AY1]|nr:SDR family NAD(P)-dependent oxidoreductase [Brevibacillus sp. AY1]
MRLKQKLVIITGVTRGLGRAMVERAEGVIINISSYWGRHGEGMVAPYCASKFAVEGLSRSLAQELPKGMAVVALDPGGSIDTAMLQQCSPGEVETAPSPEAWSRVAVPYLLKIGPKENGKSLTCPRAV